MIIVTERGKPVKIQSRQREVSTFENFVNKYFKSQYLLPLLLFLLLLYAVGIF